jgi:hypothetical protein
MPTAFVKLRPESDVPATSGTPYYRAQGHRRLISQSPGESCALICILPMPSEIPSVPAAAGDTHCSSPLRNHIPSCDSWETVDQRDLSAFASCTAAPFVTMLEICNVPHSESHIHSDDGPNLPAFESSSLDQHHVGVLDVPVRRVRRFLRSSSFAACVEAGEPRQECR